MTHPVFLSSTPFPHMPIGSEHQWLEFFQTATFELEVEAFIPILWFMLFKQENIHWAKYSDDLDLQNEPDLNVTSENLDAFSDEKYPYLIIDQTQALQNLEHNKTLFINLFGQDYLPYFEEFKSFIETNYPENILMRTSGIAIEPNDADFLVLPLQQLESLQNESVIDPDFKAFQCNDLARFEDPTYFFYGVDPTENIETPAEHEQEELEDEIENDEVPLQDSKNSSMAIWVCTAIVVIATLAIYFILNSALYAGITFLISAFVLGFISSKLGQHT